MKINIILYLIIFNLLTFNSCNQKKIDNSLLAGRWKCVFIEKGKVIEKEKYLMSRNHYTLQANLIGKVNNDNIYLHFKENNLLEFEVGFWQRFSYLQQFSVFDLNKRGDTLNLIGQNISFQVYFCEDTLKIKDEYQTIISFKKIKPQKEYNKKYFEELEFYEVNDLGKVIYNIKIKNNTFYYDDNEYVYYYDTSLVKKQDYKVHKKLNNEFLDALQEKIDRINFLDYKKHPKKTTGSAESQNIHLKIKFKNKSTKYLVYNTHNEEIKEDVLVLLTYISNLRFIFLKKIHSKV